MPRERLGYVDALRGVALVLMVINHTARYWIGPEMGWSRYHLIYLTTSVAGPIFLFLVGFVLPLSFETASRPGLKHAQRALGVVAAGYLLNVLVFPEDSWIASNVLHTIGLAILLATPLLYVMHRAAVRYAMVALAVVLYATFSRLFAPLTGWVERHPKLAEVWFYDFPLWPWMSLVLIGLVLGWGARARTGERDRARYFSVLGATAAGVLGVVFTGLAALYSLMAVRGCRFRPLVITGQAALMLYVVHHLIVVSLVQRALGIVMTSWWVYGLANAELMAALVALAAGWLAVQRARRARAAVSASAAA